MGRLGGDLHAHKSHEHSHGHDHGHRPRLRSGGWSVLTGDGLHCFGDGLLVASAFIAPWGVW
jgi:zinc and cadmium transporter